MTDSYNQESINLASAGTPTTNASGGTLLEGHIVAQSALVADAVTLTTLVQQTDVIGIIGIGAADGEQVYFSASSPFNVLVTGLVTLGAFIQASATPGVGEVGIPAQGSFAIAIEASADPGTKLVRCRNVRAELF